MLHIHIPVLENVEPKEGCELMHMYYSETCLKHIDTFWLCDMTNIMFLHQVYTTTSRNS